MDKLDLKDKKILYELDIDCRQSFRNIGKKVGLSKDVVSSRVKELQRKGIIKYFFTLIDSSKLGYNSVRIYIIFRNTTKEIEKEIIDYFVNYRYSWVVQSLKGKYDLVILFWINEINNFYKFWEKTLQKYHQYFEKKVLAIYFQHHVYKINPLLNTGDLSKCESHMYDFAGGGKKVKTDDIDKKILCILANDARIPTINIAKKLDISTLTVKSRINRLIESGVIQGYRCMSDFFKYGYKMYKTDINLIDYSKKQSIINYISKNPHLWVSHKTVGYVDLELEFLVEDEFQLHNIIEDLVKKFPNIIKNYDYFYEKEYHKIQYIPQDLIE